MAAQSHDRVTCIKLSRLKIYVSWIEECNILTSSQGGKASKMEIYLAEQIVGTEGALRIVNTYDL